LTEARVTDDIRSILLHLDATAGSFERLALAHALADRHEASVTALFGARSETVDASFAHSAGAALAAAESRPEPHARERDLLQDRLRSHESMWCEVSSHALVAAMVAEATYADLLVLGRQDESEAGGPPAGFVEAVILQSGTPAVVLPYPHRKLAIGNRVLVAWDGSLQAARAVRSALPLLRLAERVRVVTWGRQCPAAPLSRLDLPGWLRRHGIASHVQLRPPSKQVVQALASMAEDDDIDLVVMGCYGHSRIRERIFGGVTRAALARLPVAVWMAH